MHKKLILIELNEINFDAVNFYIEKGESLPGFNKLIDQGIIATKAEYEYENLEPWVQWPSVHTGKTFKEHRVFRLGDFVNSSHDQFFEQVEKAGYIALTSSGISVVPSDSFNNGLSTRLSSPSKVPGSRTYLVKDLASSVPSFLTTEAFLTCTCLC